MNKTSSAQGKGTGRSRKQLTPAPLDHYKILGVRSNARPASIKQAYIAKVKEFPPERYPEEFQNIRMAYDALRDPARRAEYDFTRKYGDSMDTLLRHAAEAFATGNYQLSEELYNKALEITPGHLGTNVGLSVLYLAEKKLSSFNKIWKQLEQSITDPKERVIAVTLKTRILMDYERYEKALSVMRALDKKHRAWRKMYIIDYSEVLIANNLETEAWKLFEETAEEMNDNIFEENASEQIEDTLFFYVHWIMIMFELNKMQFWNKVKQRCRTFLRALPDGEDKEMAVDKLLEQSLFLAESNAYKEALLFAELAYYIDPQNPEVQKQRSQAQEGAKLILEISRLLKDRSIYPGVAMSTVKFFADQAHGEESNEELPDFLPPDFLFQAGGLENKDPFMNEGIRQLKRKYPQIYKAYQEKWDKMMN
ncbi:DnaJ domain-containing protein [Paenibacillus albidus]|uniref:J domain-containing protein n=1 Tax=Paenibacillus albidus TaxID=2041023 RepID=UPI001BEA4DEA|nr:DnaJ domain-containing protein [Paenibacillus albidus]MBT2293728.1 DnaJ domain-containing protein [Paenibacillus albidus]